MNSDINFHVAKDTLFGKFDLKLRRLEPLHMSLDVTKIGSLSFPFFLVLFFILPHGSLDTPCVLLINSK